VATKTPKLSAGAPSKRLSEVAIFRLRNHLLHVCCSIWWADELFELFMPHDHWELNGDGTEHLVPSPARITFHRRRSKAEERDGLRAMLSSRRVYPPGGRTSCMVRCTSCGRDVPPYFVGSVGTCWECKLEHNCDDYTLPGGWRFTWVVSDRDALALFGQIRKLRSRSGRRPKWSRLDPRVVGGAIDEQETLSDPWLGRSGPIQ
jgi:hypothetical protein